MGSFMGHEPGGYEHWPKLFSEWLFSMDHKVIAVGYLLGSIIALLLSIFTALKIDTGWEIAGMSIADVVFHIALSMQGSVLLFGFMIPALFGFFASWVLPIMVGAKSIAFPRLHACGLWMFFSGLILAIANLFIPDPFYGFGASSIAYAFSEHSNNVMLYFCMVAVWSLSAVFLVINLIATTVSMRATGVQWMQLNMFVWSIVLAGFLLLLFMAMNFASMLMLALNPFVGKAFYFIQNTGEVFIDQTLIWAYSHLLPMLLLLPVLGLCLDIFATFTKQMPLGYPVLVGVMSLFIPASILSVVFHGYVVTSISQSLLVMATGLQIFPAVVVLFSLIWMVMRGWNRTAWSGAMFAALSVWMLLCFALVLQSVEYMTALPLGAHVLLLIILAVIQSIFAALFYFLPKLSGRVGNRWMMHASSLLFFVAALMMSVPTILLHQGVENTTANPFAIIAMYLLIAAVILSVLTVLHTLLAGEKVTEDNLWGSQSLEWSQTAVIPGQGNFPNPLIVPSDWTPYGYEQNGVIQFDLEARVASYKNK
ncbi:MAG: cbb3-type cytochrome c oxidase subunit I [Zetaproteobacteria bacterium]|nr:cbb3-type cytochrome c oxidase subunit I [Zetaproteobacteria bacterium]